MKNGFKINLPTSREAFHRNRFGRGVYTSTSKSGVGAERPGRPIMRLKLRRNRALDTRNRGPIRNSSVAKSIARGARKHGYDSIVYRSVQSKGGTNVLVIRPSNVRKVQED